MFDNYSDKLREFTDLKDALEADKNLAISENVKLQERIQQLNKDLQNERKLLDVSIIYVYISISYMLIFCFFLNQKIIL